MFEIISLKPSLVRNKFHKGPSLEIESYCDVLALAGILGVSVEPNTVKRIDINEARRRLLYAVNTWGGRVEKFACEYRVNDLCGHGEAKSTRVKTITVDDLRELLDRYEKFLNDTIAYGASFIVFP